MTDIEAEARRRLNEAEGTGFYREFHTRELNSEVEAMCRLIEEFEAYKREVSDAVEVVINGFTDKFAKEYTSIHLSRFILPKRVDPLVEEVNQIVDRASYNGWSDYEIATAAFRRGMELGREDAGE